MDRNAEITHYGLSYGLTSDSNDPNNIVEIRVDDDTRTFTATGLIPRTEYTVKVRAERLKTIFFIGPFANTIVTTRAAEGMLVVTESVR